MMLSLGVPTVKRAAHSIKRRTEVWDGRFRGVQRDSKTGLLYYVRYGEKIFIKNRSHFSLPMDDVYRNIFFAHYLPSNTDVVVDIGAGYGEEAAYLHSISPDVTYIGVEIQPSIFECLATTFSGISDRFLAFPLALSNDKEIVIDIKPEWLEVGEGSAIHVPAISWERFLGYFGIDEIDLLKVNIEGGETHLLASIADFSKIKRIIVSCHDFRAERGDGERFRTKAKVEALLDPHFGTKRGFFTGINWADDWLFYTHSDV
jgi:FkbM family methyltransferase